MCGIFTTALDTDALESLLHAAPRLAVCDADVRCSQLALARRLLRNEPPFAPLHLRSFEFDDGEAEMGEADVVALSADFTSHAHLRRLHLDRAPLNTAATLDAVVDAALTRRLTSVALSHCQLPPELAPALMRLVGGGALAELDICGSDLEPGAVLALGNALRASSTLTTLSLQ
jgi:hypothetical protein